LKHERRRVLAYAVTPESFEDVVNLLVPGLQRRGVYPTAYKDGTLRDKLFGEGAHLPAAHPGASYRDLAAVHRREAAATPSQASAAD
jgi:long-chain alkane monooxygenase